MSDKPWTFESIRSKKVEASYDSTPRKWTKPWYGCFSNFGVCCWVLWCQPCTIAQVYGLSGSSGLSSRLGCNIAFLLLFLLFVLGSVFYENGTGTTVFPILLFLVSFFFVFQARKAIRNSNNINGNVCWDILLSWCCMPCTVCQIFTQKNVRACSSDPNAIEYGTPFQAVVYERSDSDERDIVCCEGGCEGGCEPC